MSNIQQLLKIPLILDAQEVFLNDEILSQLHEKGKKFALENAEKNYVYRIVYKSQGHKVVGYITEPKEGEKLPCIIFNRGGSNEFGMIKDESLFAGHNARFAYYGYICIASQYSGNDGSEGKDEHGGGDIEDMLNLYKILQKYSRADIKKVGMYGGSRGGMMTYIALSKVKWIKAAVVVAGLADLISQATYRPEMTKKFKNMFGGSLLEKKKRSAIYWPERFHKKTPILIMHGTADWRVNPLDSLVLAQKLYEQKVPYRLIVYEGADHGLDEFRKESINETFNWFDKYLKNNEKLPKLEPHGD